MKQKIKELYILAIRIGWLKALKLIHSSKIENNSNLEVLINVYLTDESSPIFLRRFSSDISVFNAVFNDLEYDFPIGFTPKYIVDCGANIGLTSLFLKLKFKESIVIAVEPELSNFELLKMNTVNFPDIKPINAGVWSSSAELQIANNSSTGWAVETILKSSANISDLVVEAFSIDDLMNRFSFDYIDILKIDIEGSEKQLFKENYENWLPKTKILVIELHNMINNKISKIFFNALSKYDFDIRYKGENLICYNKKYLINNDNQ